MAKANSKKESKNPIVKFLEEMSADRKIPLDILIPLLEESFAKAYRYSNPNDVIEAYYDGDEDEFKIMKVLRVVDELEDDNEEILTEDAQEIVDTNFDEISSINGKVPEHGTSVAAGDELRLKISLDSLGRIAVQNLKQTMNSKMLEAEHNLILSEFTEKFDSLIQGRVLRLSKDRGRSNTLYVNIGRTDAVLLAHDQNKLDVYSEGATYNFAIKEIKNTNKGPQIYVSRTDPKLIKLLFKSEVPEIATGEVEIMGISREAGSRTKISVRAENSDIDPVGACVGPRGMRLENVINELNGEKIDVIEWSENPAVLISNALSPARVMRVEIYEDEKSALVVVPDDQLSLAIGKEGQNARLAVRLTEWRKIDIKSESEYDEYVDDDYEDYDEDEFDAELDVELGEDNEE